MGGQIQNYKMILIAKVEVANFMNKMALFKDLMEISIKSAKSLEIIIKIA